MNDERICKNCIHYVKAKKEYTFGRCYKLQKELTIYCDGYVEGVETNETFGCSLFVKININ
jgi:hypothetical protein